MSPVEFNLFLWLANSGLEGWHLGLASAALLLFFVVKGKVPLTFLKIGNGNHAREGQGEKLMTYQRFLEFRSTINAQLSKHERETEKIQQTIEGIRSQTQKNSEALARIEGLLEKK